MHLVCCSCWFYPLNLVNQPFVCLPELHLPQQEHWNSKMNVKCLAGSVLTFTGLDWNSLDSSCTKVNLGTNNVPSFNWGCIEQVTTPGGFQLVAAIRYLQAGLLLWALHNLHLWAWATCLIKPLKWQTGESLWLNCWMLFLKKKIKSKKTLYLLPVVINVIRNHRA